MPTEAKVDPFKPKQPEIPGVPANAGEKKPTVSRPAGAEPSSVPSSAISLWPPSVWPVGLRIGVAAAAVVIILALAWRARVSSARPAEPEASAPVAPVAVLPAQPAQALPIGPGEIATASELAKPWSSKRFLFRDPSSELVPALAVRLPGGALWGISLREPYGNCKLDYLTNLGTLHLQYDFNAKHPMVVNPCSGSVYDLGQYTGGPNGLVRGQVVRGTAIRAPFAVEIVQHGKSIVAVRMEQGL